MSYKCIHTSKFQVILFLLKKKYSVFLIAKLIEENFCFDLGIENKTLLKMFCVWQLQGVFIDNLWLHIFQILFLLHYAEFHPGLYRTWSLCDTILVPRYLNSMTPGESVQKEVRIPGSHFYPGSLPINEAYSKLTADHIDICPKLRIIISPTSVLFRQIWKNKQNNKNTHS